MGRFADILREEMEPENPLRSGDTQVAILHMLERLEELEAEERRLIEEATDKALERMGHLPTDPKKALRQLLSRRRARRGAQVTEAEFDAEQATEDPEDGWFFSVQGVIRFEDGQEIFDGSTTP